jgi:short-subunit dehydrogenase
MAYDMKGARVLVTGASSGIGRSLVRLAAGQGARLLAVGRSEVRLNDLVRELPGAEIVPVVGDVTRPADRQRMLDTAVQRFGGLDVLVNNAGVASFGHFSTSSEEVMRQVMEVNFFAPAELMRLAIPLLTQGRHPAIVNVASMCGRRGVPAWPEYSASKFALCGLNDALRAEFARFDVDVLLIVPGLTQTSLRENLLHNTGRLKIDFEEGMKPEVVAEGILRALRKRKRETVLGWEARWILRVNRWLPWLVDRLMARKVRKLYEQEARGGLAAARLHGQTQVQR